MNSSTGWSLLSPLPVSATFLRMACQASSECLIAIWGFSGSWGYHRFLCLPFISSYTLSDTMWVFYLLVVCNDLLVFWSSSYFITSLCCRCCPWVPRFDNPDCTVCLLCCQCHLFPESCFYFEIQVICPVTEANLFIYRQHSPLRTCNKPYRSLILALHFIYKDIFKEVEFQRDYMTFWLLIT